MMIKKIDINANEIRSTIEKFVSLDLTLISMFACEEPKEHFSIYYIFADRKVGELTVITAKIGRNQSFDSISLIVAAAGAYEREIQDMFGLKPIGHPRPKRLVHHRNWPKNYYPLRKDFPVNCKLERADIPEEFEKIKGEGVYEIPVGPVHAGIIEPGHFRFSVAGEPIINLEAQLYFVHKGIEKLAENRTFEKGYFLAERISGDESFANSLAYCLAVEMMAGIRVPERAEYTRVIFAELERLIAHMGDLSGICMDVAYGFANAHFGMLRIWSYNLADLLCGVRMLRNVNCIGGVRKEFIEGKEEEIKNRLSDIKKELKDIAKIIKHNGLFLDRVEHTGILQKKIADDLNATGPGGRASGVNYDVRTAFPYAAYDKLSIKIPNYIEGDVKSRMNTKIGEALTSIELIIEAIDKMPKGILRAEGVKETLAALPENKLGIGIVESPRGEDVHVLISGKDGHIGRYKVRTASFCNWQAFVHAVNGNVVPDFPLINKSFNLSYSGNDL